MRKLVMAVLLAMTWVFGSTISNVQVGSITNEKFVVSWKSAVSEVGSVKILSSSGDSSMNGKILRDVRDTSLSALTDTSGIMHIVVVWGMYTASQTGALAPNTTYTIEINSGGTLTTSIVTTGADLGQPSSPPEGLRTGYVLDSHWVNTNAVDTIYTSFVEHRNGDGSVVRSAPRIFIANRNADPNDPYYENLYDYRAANLQSRYYPAGVNLGDDLVVNFAHGDGTDVQLRRVLSILTPVSVSLTPNIFPVIDNFDAQATSATPLGWNIAGMSASISAAGYFSAKSVQMNGSASLASPYYVGFMSKYLNEGKALDWLQYRYLKVVLKNNGPIGTKVNFNLFDDPTMTNSTQGPFVATINLLKRDVWTEVYIPLNDFILKGSRPINFRQGIQMVGVNNSVYAGPSQIGFSVSSTTPTGSASVLVDDIQLVTSLPAGTDADWDGISDSLEGGYGIGVSNILADNDLDGIANYSELLNNTDPNVANLFPLIDGFEGHGYTWLASRGTSTIVTGTAPGDWNGTHALDLTGTSVVATPSFAGFTGTWVQDASIDFGNQYKSMKFVLKNLGRVGDRIKIQLQSRHNGVGIDKWEFEQVINNTNQWDYYTVPLNKFVRTLDSVGDGVIDFSPSGNVGGLLYVGISMLTRGTTGNFHVLIDSLEASTVPTSDDTDGDGLPDAWEIASGLNPNNVNGDLYNASSAFGSFSGDQFANIDKYVAGLSANVAYNFPMIEDFTAPVGWSTAGGASVAYSPGVATITGLPVSGYVGYFGKYIGNPLTDWAGYNYIKIRVNNQGHVGDRIDVSFTDNHFPTYSVLAADDVYSASIIINNTNTWNDYYIPIAQMTQVTGSMSTMNLSPIAGFPGVLMIGLNFRAASGNMLNVIIDSIGLEVTMSATGINPLVGSTTRNIPAGWSLVSLGLSGNIRAVLAAVNAQAGADVVTQAYKYVGGPTPWQGYSYPSVGGFNVTSTDAVYIYSSVPVVFNPGKISLPPTTVYNFSADWNTFTRPLFIPMTISELCSSIQSSTGANSLLKVAVYRGGEWVIYDVATALSSGTIRLRSTELVGSTTGYFLKFANSGSWILQ